MKPCAEAPSGGGCRCGQGPPGLGSYATRRRRFLRQQQFRRLRFFAAANELHYYGSTYGKVLPQMQKDEGETAPKIDKTLENEKDSATTFFPSTRTELLKYLPTNQEEPQAEQQILVAPAIEEQQDASLDDEKDSPFFTYTRTELLKYLPINQLKPQAEQQRLVVPALHVEAHWQWTEPSTGDPLKFMKRRISVLQSEFPALEGEDLMHKYCFKHCNTEEELAEAFPGLVRLLIGSSSSLFTGPDGEDEPESCCHEAGT